MKSVDPFDLSKALDGAAKAHLDPTVSRFILDAEYEPAGDQEIAIEKTISQLKNCLLYTSPSPRDVEESRMPSSA